jgi:hypothetical protein
MSIIFKQWERLSTSTSFTINYLKDQGRGAYHTCVLYINNHANLRFFASFENTRLDFCINDKSNYIYKIKSNSVKIRF